MKAILTYHSLEGSGSVVSLDPGRFRQQMEWLASQGPAVVPLERLLESREEEAVALTFDDAFANFADSAWPVLQDLGFPVTLFVPTGHVGGQNGWEPDGGRIPRMRLLDWERIAALAEAGVALGSHTVTHADLRGLPAARCEEELLVSADRIAAETGQRPTAFAYPYGRCDETSRSAVARIYECAVTTDFRPVAPVDEPHRLPRLDTWYFRRPGSLEAWGTPGFRRYLAVRRALRVARTLITKE